MLYRKLSGDRFKYVAVTEVQDITTDKNLYGQKRFRFLLADGSQHEETFEADVWPKWQGAVWNGGCVVNPD